MAGSGWEGSPRHASPPRWSAAIAAVTVLLAAACSAGGAASAPSRSTAAPSSMAPPSSSAAQSSTTAPASAAAPSSTAADPVVEPTTTATAAAVASPASTYDFSHVAPIVERFIADHGLDGAGLVVVERNDGVVHEAYWGEFGPERVSLIASASKMIVAGVLLRLDDLGLLDIDAPVADAVEWGAANPDITPAQLLSNSSGLVGLQPYPAYAPYVCQFLPAGDIEECGETIFTTTADDADVVAPDTAFRYGGGQWQVAGAVAETVSGRSWAELLSDTYGEPCGVTSLGFNNHWTQFDTFDFEYPTDFDADPSTLAPTANPNMEGGGYITAPDYARLLLMQLRDGRCGATQVLSPESLDRMHEDRIGPIYGTTNFPGAQGYGLGWWIDTAAEGTVSDPGAYGAVPWLDLADGYGAYLVLEADVFLANELLADLQDVVDTAITAAR